MREIFESDFTASKHFLATAWMNGLIGYALYFTAYEKLTFPSQYQLFCVPTLWLSILELPIRYLIKKKKKSG